MFAVIESGGKQHTVSEGDSLKIELISGEEGSTIAVSYTHLTLPTKA